MRELKYSLPEQVRARLGVPDDALIDAHLATVRPTVRGDVMAEVRHFTLEARTDDDTGAKSLVGWATTWDTFYDVAGGPPMGWSETMVRGSANKAVAEHDDVRFLFDHTGIPNARHRGLPVDTMTLSIDQLGLRYDVPNLDTDRNVFAAALWSAIERKDVDQCSMAFQVMRQEWNNDWTERRILEVRLFDVSAVTYPANTATIIGARTAEQPTRTDGFPLSLAIAQAALL
jgi:hypothetical protein